MLNALSTRKLIKFLIFHQKFILKIIAVQYKNVKVLLLSQSLTKSVKFWLNKKGKLVYSYSKISLRQENSTLKKMSNMKRWRSAHSNQKSMITKIKGQRLKMKKAWKILPGFEITFKILKEPIKNSKLRNRLKKRYLICKNIMICVWKIVKKE